MSPHQKMKALDTASTAYQAHVKWQDGTSQTIDIHSHTEEWFEFHYNGNAIFGRFDKVEYFAVEEL